MKNDRFTFRFWLPGSEQILPGSEITVQEDLSVADIFDNKDTVTMQWIGAADECGCRIFEGDIVHAPDLYPGYYGDGPGIDGVLVIIFDEKEFFGFVGVDESGGMHLLNDWCSEGNSTLKVIGNIYENPEKDLRP